MVLLYSERSTIILLFGLRINSEILKTEFKKHFCNAINNISFKAKKYSIYCTVSMSYNS